MRFYADWHTHTCYSHGAGTILDNARAARVRGLAEVAIADHGPANLFGVGVNDLDTFARIQRDIAAVNNHIDGVKVLYAVEANIIDTDGRLDIPLPMQASFDLVLAGLHMLVRPHSWWNAAQVATANIVAKIWDDNRKSALVTNTDLLVAAVYRNHINIITHPGYRLPVDTRELAKACAATNTAMEINTSHTYTTPRYIQRAACEGVWFVIGSDAHIPERVGDLEPGWKLAREAGLSPDQILNMSVEGRDQTRRSEIFSMSRNQHNRS